MTESTDDFDEHVKRQILTAFGYASEAELNTTIEEAFPGYLAAHAEWEAEKAAFGAELQGRVEEAKQAVAWFLRNRGMLPDGVELEVVPMDLQADAQWMAQAPWMGQPVTVDYATDRPPQPLAPDAPELTEEQKQAAAEAASAQIEEWRRQWVSVVDDGPSEEFLTDLANPIPLEPKATPWRDKPRTWEYPCGG